MKNNLLEIIEDVKIIDNKDGIVFINDVSFDSRELAELIYKLSDLTNDLTFSLSRYGSIK